MAIMFLHFNGEEYLVILKLNSKTQKRKDILHIVHQKIRMILYNFMLIVFFEILI